MSKQTPVCFLHWLEKPSDAREAEPVYQSLKSDLDITYRDVNNREAALAAITEWLADNPNAQFLFIGAHGDKDGLGDTVAGGVDWPELGTLLRSNRPCVALWLGACESSGAALGWSPVKEPIPASYIVGFPDKVLPMNIQPVLRQLVKMAGMTVTYIDDELPKIKAIAGGTRVTMHYPAVCLDGSHRYVDVEDFEAEVGQTFHGYLVDRGLTGISPMFDEIIDGLERQSERMSKEAKNG